MDLIPAWVRKLWGAWDVRILVLLSLNLQIILCVFGHRRKYIKSQRISILVWLAYLMADWVATVALGKLSDESTSNSNNTIALRAIWAPLLLLHLGGPDTITAYSLEDNQLWMRHLMGLAVQLVVAVYVILISWRNFGFSYFSFPALVAGIIKYGERTWVLKSVCTDKCSFFVPFFIVRPNDDLDTIRRNDDPNNALESKYEFLHALLLGHLWLAQFRGQIQNFDINYGVHFRKHSGSPKVQWDKRYFWDALEVEMGLMYDILFTKAAKIYTKRGFILRSISFACTMSILVGLFWLISRKEMWSLEQDYYSMLVDFIITGLLLVGALALEIYALTMLLTSDWTMIWLIKQKREETVIQLGQKVPWLFPMHRKRRWSRKMGQFDARGFWSKQQDMNTSMLGRVLGLLGIQDKFNKYMHMTYLDVDPTLYSLISHYLHFLSSPNLASNSSPVRERFKFVKDDFVEQKLRNLPFEEQLIYLHVVTEVLFDNDASDLNATYQTRRTACRNLSCYMMYLYMVCPSLLPIVRLDTLVVDLGMTITDAIGVDGARTDLRNIHFSKTLTKYLETKQEAERWRILGTKWLEMICHVAFRAQKNDHLQLLTQGGELLTLVWCFIAQASKIGGLDAELIFSKLNDLIRSPAESLERLV